MSNQGWFEKKSWNAHIFNGKEKKKKFVEPEKRHLVREMRFSDEEKREK
jgi:hypothetical protein